MCIYIHTYVTYVNDLTKTMTTTALLLVTSDPVQSIPEANPLRLTEL